MTFNESGTTMSINTSTLSPELARKMDAYWRAANYLSVGQIYLYDNPLLKRPLTLGDVKHMLLGHWGTTPGQNFIYMHLNRVIKKYDLDMIYVSGPGHGGRPWWLRDETAIDCIPEECWLRGAGLWVL
jgi:xylulose-5-phosphate/fructose-6-phosphate phosphoketolase